MATVNQALPRPRHAAPSFGLSALFVTGLCAALGLMVMRPLLGLIAGIGVVLAACAFAWPTGCTLAVMFLLYTNAPVVAVRFHNVPMPVAAAVPLLLTVPLVYSFVIQRKPLVVDRVLPLIVAFLVIQYLGAVFSIDPVYSLAILGTSAIEGLGLYFLVINTVRTAPVLRQVVWTLLAAGALMGAVSTYQQATRSFHTDLGGFGQLSEGGFSVQEKGQHAPVHQRRLAGPIGEQNRYAQIMLMLVPLGLFAWRWESAGAKRLAILAATVLAAAGFLLTFSRGGVVGAALTLLVAAAMGYVRLRHLALAGVLALVTLLLIPQYRTRLATLAALGTYVSETGPTEATAPDGAIQGRLTEMIAAMMVFNDHPILGVGPGMFRFYSSAYSKDIGIRDLEGTRQAHSLYPGLAADHGIVGLVCFLAILGVTLWGLAHARRAVRFSASPYVRWMAGGFFLAVVSYMATGIFLHFAYVRYFWLMLGLAGAVVEIARHERRMVARHALKETI